MGHRLSYSAHYPFPSARPNNERLARATLHQTPTGGPGQPAAARSRSLVPVSLPGRPQLSALSPQPNREDNAVVTSTTFPGLPASAVSSVPRAHKNRPHPLLSSPISRAPPALEFPLRPESTRGYCCRVHGRRWIPCFIARAVRSESSTRSSCSRLSWCPCVRTGRAPPIRRRDRASAAGRCPPWTLVGGSSPALVSPLLDSWNP